MSASRPSWGGAGQVAGSRPCLYCPIRTSIACLLLISMSWPVLPAEFVEVRPVELQGLIQTPGVGRQTFNTTSLAAAEGYPSGAAYFRYTWAQLEPRKGEYNWALIDKSLAEVRMQGRTMDIGPIMLNDDRDARWTPQWMRDKGLVVWPSGGIDWASADLLANHRDFILDFAARYDGHPDISSIDIRSIGAWGEWHQYNDPDPAHFPSWDIQKQVIDLYYSSFKKTPLVMLVGGR